MSTLTNVRLPQNRSRQLDERGIRLLRTRTRQQGLARSGRAVEQNALRRLDSELLEEFRVRQRKDDRFLQLRICLSRSTDV